MKINQSKKLLITGIPGMGKTTIGNYLRDKHNFIHIDMECLDNFLKIRANSEIFINNLINLDKNLVITWGFFPDEHQISCVNLFKDKGFKLIWLDGDINSAYREFIKRDSQYGEQFLKDQQNNFNNQLQRIKESNVINEINPKTVNTFNSKHEFRKLKDIIKEIEYV